jgi:hypothetical protein
MNNNNKVILHVQAPCLLKQFPLVLNQAQKYPIIPQSPPKAGHHYEGNEQRKARLFFL